METAIEGFIQDFERGRITRRQLVKHVAAAAAAETSTFKATSLNHIALAVPDIDISRDFYVKHLGMKVVRNSASNCFMTCNDNFVALFRNSTPGMDHYCYSVEDFDVRDAEAKLKAEGLAPRVEGNRIYFKDPDGLTVQLASSDHRP